MSTPKTNKALAAILERDGELSEENAPEVLVKLCRELESEADQLRDQVVNSRKQATHPANNLSMMEIKQNLADHFGVPISEIISNPEDLGFRSLTACVEGKFFDVFFDENNEIYLSLPA